MNNPILKAIETKPLTALEKDYPFIISFLEDQMLDPLEAPDALLADALEALGRDQATITLVKAELLDYIESMLSFLGEEQELVETITIIAGRDKDGKAEPFKECVIHKGEIMAIVGPTGSGKSRLLADIEWAARGDTPTGRTILINGEIRHDDHRFSSRKNLVAQLSQNMNFVMDVTVAEFISLHAQSRMVAQTKEMVDGIVRAANYLCGEAFDPNTPITSLSGGQSRALMIADTAMLSISPIVLIDEIENAGIDRKRAMDLLVGEEKIVLIATHDPSLALLADRRLVIRNGGIASIQERKEDEKAILETLNSMDKVYDGLRQQLRAGAELKI